MTRPKKKQTTKTDINKATIQMLAEMVREDLAREEKERMRLQRMGRKGYIPEEILDMFRTTK